jgi:hypothetical protein
MSRFDAEGYRLRKESSKICLGRDSASALGRCGASPMYWRASSLY